MARPIIDTPILFGEYARRFEEVTKYPLKETKEQKELRVKDYKLAMKMLKV